jgi:hypothetical protein
MSYGSQYNLSARLSYLESIINQIAPFLPLDLSNVLIQGNSADNSIILTDGVNKASTLTKDSLLIDDGSGGIGVTIQSEITPTTITVTNSLPLGNPNTTSISAGFISLLDDTLNNCSLSPTQFDIQSPSATPFTVTSDTAVTVTTTGYDLTLNASGGSGLFLNSADNTTMNVGVNLIATATDDIQLNATNNNITLNALNSQIVSNSSSFAVNSGDYITLTANNDYMTLQADDDITLSSAGLGNINLNAPNINSYNWAMPICFNAFNQSNFSYTLGGQAFEDVLLASPLPIVPLPTEFFASTPQSGYTTSRWQINFDMNIYNGTGLYDKAFAIYILFNDSLGNTYTPFLYNDSRPFVRWTNPSTYSGSGSPYMPVNWCDYVDFNPMIGSFDSNINIQMWIAADNAISGEFYMKLGFTRINRV